MQAHQQRVVTEQADLQYKIDKLYAFTVGELFKTIDEAEQGRLNEQLQHMIQYNRVLLERLTAFKQAA